VTRVQCQLGVDWLAIVSVGRVLEGLLRGVAGRQEAAGDKRQEAVEEDQEEPAREEWEELEEAVEEEEEAVEEEEEVVVVVVDVEGVWMGRWRFLDVGQ
jgi:hypothetical protein